MITAGIDVGSQTIKVVVLSDGKIAGANITRCAFATAEIAEKVLETTLAECGIPRQGLDRITATGAGGRKISFADTYVTDISCSARGAVWLAPTVRTVIDIGAEGNRGARCEGNGSVLDFAKNDKCAAGVGAFVESMARALETSVEEMGPLSLQSDKEIPMNVTCVIFAESEVVSHIHAKTPKADIARAINDAIGSRTAAMIRRIGVESDVAVVGGVAKNVGVISALKRLLGTDLVIPENPQLASALGAALVAAS